MALPSSGSISLGQVNTELGVSATATRSLGETTTRNLFGVASGAISMSQGYGKANQFSLNITTNQTNVNLRSLALSSGWNGSSKVVATLSSGVYISGSSTGTAALVIDGSFPGGLDFINNGYILGLGGNGGQGGYAGGNTSSGGQSGASGGKALEVSTAVTFTNNGTIGGGGGGGGGGGPASYSGYKRLYTFPGGGGGGGRSSLNNSSGGARGNALGGWSVYNAQPGGSGTSSGAGAGGNTGGSYSYAVPGKGGDGGNWGASGSSGVSGSGWGSAGGGGGGGSGAAVSGNSYITWAATGTRYGGIS